MHRCKTASELPTASAHDVKKIYNLFALHTIQTIIFYIYHMHSPYKCAAAADAKMSVDSNFTVINIEVKID